MFDIIIGLTLISYGAHKTTVGPTYWRVSCVTCTCNCTMMGLLMPIYIIYCYFRSFIFITANNLAKQSACITLYYRDGHGT